MRTSFSACLLSLLLASGTHAEVYKWVDASGQTHYSERKADARGAKTAEVKITAAPEASKAPAADYSDYLRASSKYAPPGAGVSNKPSTKNPPEMLSDGMDHGTDGSRCALARDILNGAVRHGNGKALDQYDRDVAKNDVKSFCRSR